MNTEIVGPVNEPGFRGYKVYVDGVHVRTERLLRDARKFVEGLALSAADVGAA